MKHRCTYRVPYADTDQMAVVYHANYIEYFERSRTEMLRDYGFPYTEVEKLGLYLMVAEVHCKYCGSAKYDDLLTFESHICELRKASLTIYTEVKRGDEVLAIGKVRLASASPELKLIRMPQFFLERVAPLVMEPETV